MWNSFEYFVIARYLFSLWYYNHYINILNLFVFSTVYRLGVVCSLGPLQRMPLGMFFHILLVNILTYLCCVYDQEWNCWSQWIDFYVWCGEEIKTNFFPYGYTIDSAPLMRRTCFTQYTSGLPLLQIKWPYGCGSVSLFCFCYLLWKYVTSLLVDPWFSLVLLSEILRSLNAISQTVKSTC